MTLVKISVLACGLAAITACGSLNQSSKDDATKTVKQTNVTAASAKVDVRQANLPLAGIIRVPVDLDGKELVNQADFRTISGTTQMTEAQAVSAAYDAGTTPANVKDELDNDSSSESWGSWGGSCGGYGNYGYNNYGYSNYGYSNYGYGGYNSYYYSSWRPSCNYYGYSYNYSSPSYYNCGGYNYYYYPNSYYY